MKLLWWINGVLWVINGGAWIGYSHSAFMAILCFVAAVGSTLYADKLDTYSWPPR